MDKDNYTYSKDYGQAFQNLTEAVATGDTDGMRQYAKKSLDFARLLGHKHLEIAVLCTTAAGFLSAGQLQTTLKVYEEALTIADNTALNPEQKEEYTQLAVQIMLYKASALLTQKTPQYNAIIEAYQQVVDRLQLMIADRRNAEIADPMQDDIVNLYHFEALRILGYCQEQLGRQQAALKHYVKAVSTAEQMGEEMLKSAPIYLVGNALLSLCRKLGMKKEYFIVIDKMNGLLGTGWEKQSVTTV
jgi:tetratricopeptide (TPR) repeat protein